jgi:hypothetical protein
LFSLILNKTSLKIFRENKDFSLITLIADEGSILPNLF